MHFRVAPHLSSLSTQPHASSALPRVMPARQTESVITLDLWFNRLWQHWKVVNVIAFFICISVVANKSKREHSFPGFPGAEPVKSNCPAVTPS